MLCLGLGVSPTDSGVQPPTQARQELQLMLLIKWQDHYRSTSNSAHFRKRFNNYTQNATVILSVLHMYLQWNSDK